MLGCRHATDATGPGRVRALLASLQRDTPGLSYTKLADAAGVHRSQVWRWVNADSTPGYEPVRRLAAWLAEHYPHLADTAARLLPAAGYAAPDEPTIPGGVPPAAGPDPIAARIGHAVSAEMARIRGEEAIAEYERIAGEVAGEIAARRAARIPEDQIFRDKFERNLWLTELTPEYERVLAIAVLRSARQHRPPNSDTNPPVELAG